MYRRKKMIKKNSKTVRLIIGKKRYEKIIKKDKKTEENIEISRAVEGKNIGYFFPYVAFVVDNMRTLNYTCESKNVTSFRRVLGMVYGKYEAHNKLSNWITNNVKGEDIAKELENDGVYLANICDGEDLGDKIRCFIDDFINTKKDDERLIVLALGSDAIKFSKKLETKYKCNCCECTRADITFLNYIHPSPQNNEIFFEAFDVMSKPREYTSKSELIDEFKI